MADGFVRVPLDDSGKKVDASEISVGANTVERQRIVISSDSSAAEFAAVSSGSLSVAVASGAVTARPTDGTHPLTAMVDADSGVGTEYVLPISLRKTASGGSVELGTSTDPIRVDTVNTTVQTVNWSGQTVTAAQATAANLNATVVGTGTFAVQAAEADGANVTLGAKADAKSAATDTTAVSAMSVLKQISASVQAPPSQAVTNAGTFAVQATLAAETTKVIGTVNVAAAQTIGITANSSVNVAQINGVTALMGNGVTGTGSQRVTIASDNTAFSVNAAATLAAETTKVIGVVRTADGSGNLLTSTTNALDVNLKTSAASNISCNNAQINGVTPLMGNGTTGTGSQRVTIASDNTAFSVNATTVPTTTGGCTIFSANNAGTKAAVKASAGQIYGWQILNTTAAIAYVQLFNVASASVTVGSTAPDLVLGLPASGGATFSSDVGIAFGTAITVACTTTRAGSTGASCEVAIFYK